MIDDHPHNYEFYILKHRWEHVKTALIEGATIPPFEIEIQPNSICDLVCPWCIGNKIQGKDRQIGNSITSENVDALVDHIIEYEVGSFKVDTIRLSGLIGDPLINNEISIRLIKRFLDAKRKVGLFTSGVHLNDTELKTLIAKIDYLHISLDAGTPQTFSRLKLKENNNEKNLLIFDTILKNIEDIVQIRKQNASKLEISIGYILTPYNYFEIIEFARHLKKIGVNRMRFKRDITGKYNLEKYQHHEVYNNLLERIYNELVDDSFKISVTHGQEYDPELEKIPQNLFNRCLSHYLWGTIGSDGNVYACDHTTFLGGPSYGNVITTSFKDIWEGKQRGFFINSLPKKNMCVSCSPFAVKINKFLNKVLELVDTNGIQKIEDWRNEIVFQ